MGDLLGALGIGRKTVVMGVLNVTPDSFSDGGRHADPAAAVEEAQRMWSQGAGIIDVGGESTRPATFQDGMPLDPAEELKRVLPVIERLARESPEIVISIDTYKAVVAEAALDSGARIINDISGLSYDAAMSSLAARSGAPLVLMHLPGKPRSLPSSVVYADIIQDICAFFNRQIRAALDAGVARSQVVLDPGIGFGKDALQNYEVLRRLEELRMLGLPLLIGPSRKNFIAKALGGAAVDDRVEGTAAAVAIGIAHGADIVRVHDVAQMAKVCRVADAIMRPGAATDLA